MPVIDEEFIRCSECENPYFKQEERLIFHKTIRERDDPHIELPALEKVYVYKCIKCGNELPK